MRDLKKLMYQNDELGKEVDELFDLIEEIECDIIENYGNDTSELKN